VPLAACESLTMCSPSSDQNTVVFITCLPLHVEMQDVITFAAQAGRVLRSAWVHSAAAVVQYADAASAQCIVGAAAGGQAVLGGASLRVEMSTSTRVNPSMCSKPRPLPGGRAAAASPAQQTHVSSAHARSTMLYNDPSACTLEDGSHDPYAQHVVNVHAGHAHHAMNAHHALNAHASVYSEHGAPLPHSVAAAPRGVCNMPAWMVQSADLAAQALATMQGTSGAAHAGCAGGPGTSPTHCAYSPTDDGAVTPPSPAYSPTQPHAASPHAHTPTASRDALEEAVCETWEGVRSLQLCTPCPPMNTSQHATETQRSAHVQDALRESAAEAAEAEEAVSNGKRDAQEAASAVAHALSEAVSALSMEVRAFLSSTAPHCVPAAMITATSPAYVAASPAYAPTSPPLGSHATSPVYVPTSPPLGSHATSPLYAPTSPPLGSNATSPVYVPTSPPLTSAAALLSTPTYRSTAQSASEQWSPAVGLTPPGGATSPRCELIAMPSQTFDAAATSVQAAPCNEQAQAQWAADRGASWTPLKLHLGKPVLTSAALGNVPHPLGVFTATPLSTPNTPGCVLIVTMQPPPTDAITKVRHSVTACRVAGARVITACAVPRSPNAVWVSVSSARDSAAVLRRLQGGVRMSSAEDCGIACAEGLLKLPCTLTVSLSAMPTLTGMLAVEQHAMGCPGTWHVRNDGHVCVRFTGVPHEVPVKVIRKWLHGVALVHVSRVKARTASSGASRGTKRSRTGEGVSPSTQQLPIVTVTVRRCAPRTATDAAHLYGAAGVVEVARRLVGRWAVHAENSDGCNDASQQWRLSSEGATYPSKCMNIVR